MRIWIAALAATPALACGAPAAQVVKADFARTFQCALPDVRVRPIETGPSREYYAAGCDREATYRCERTTCSVLAIPYFHVRGLAPTRSEDRQTPAQARPDLAALAREYLRTPRDDASGQAVRERIRRLDTDSAWLLHAILRADPHLTPLERMISDAAFEHSLAIGKSFVDLDARDMQAVTATVQRSLAAERAATQ